ncbi:MAG: cysteine synthase A [Alphaproteobacteria bacterium]|nr:cysteine synthase A [Alphaproteobacteria bacterium]HCQ70724.1 cysteine synthase A [Rhodospirillaceae bacterium]
MKTFENTPESLKPTADTRGKVYGSVLEVIGATPLVKLPRLTAKYQLKADILAKLEYLNPLASEKDRAAFAMITAAEREGKITAGQSRLIVASSGNAAVSLAFVASAKGYRLIVVLPETVSLERRKILKILGADLALTPAERGMKGAMDRAAELAGKEDGGYVIDLFDNQPSVQIQRETTAKEIWFDTEGKVDILVAGVGTGATLTGMTQVLKQQKPDLRSYAVEPAESAVLSGGEAGPHKIQGIGAGFVPPLLDQSLVDGIVKITNEEAIQMAREAASIEGLACGLSSGAALAAAIKVAQIADNAGKQIVTVLASPAERYLSTALFDGLEIS